MRNRRNYYRLLKVQPDAPIEIIRATYRTLMRELRQHPDLGGSTEMAAILNEAYEVLSNETKRAEYDREISLGLKRQGSTSPVRGKAQRKQPACPFCRHTLARKVLPGDRCPNCESPVKSQEMADLENASRRSVVRMKRDDRIAYYTAWPQERREGRLVDLSPRGTRFLCSEFIRKGSVLKIRAGAFEALATVTNVRSVSTLEEELYSIGASFIAVSFGGCKGTFLSASA